MKKPQEQRLIKKYQNRRLYDTATSTYIVLEDIKQMIMEGELVKVIDIKSDLDVTRSVLLQIIAEEEANSSPIFSNDFLVQVIRFYGKAFQPAISPFLEQGMDMLRQTQRKFYAQLKAMHPKDSIPSSLELWKEFWNAQGAHVQQNILDYLTTSTNNFIQMQEQVQEELQSQASSIMNMIKFPFNNPSKKGGR